MAGGGLGGTRNNQSSAPVPAPAIPTPPSGTTTTDVQSRLPINDINHTGISVLSYPSVRPKYFMSFEVAAYNRRNPVQLGTLTTLAALTLPLPKQLVDRQNINYDQTPLGTFVGGGSSIISSGLEGLTGMSADRAAQMKNVNSAGAGTIRGKLAENSIVSAAGGVATLAGSALGGVGEALNAQNGYSPNQFMTILLKGPEYKRHSFSWKFSANDEGESRSLDKIIRNLKEWSAPGLTFGGAIFTFPLIFKIFFSPNEKLMYSFKPAVLESLTVDFTPADGPSFYRAGADGANAPESLAISMSFLELEFWLAGRGDFGASSQQGGPIL